MQLSEEDSYYVKYARICPLQFCDFTPARVTRRSENPLLQEHCAIDMPALYETVRKRHNSSLQIFSVLNRAAEEGERKLRGKYVELQFADSYPGCDGLAAPSVLQPAPSSGSCGAVGGEASSTTPTTPSPLFVRSRTERRRTAFRKRSVTKSGGSTESCEIYCSLASEPGAERDMDVESGVVIYHDRLGTSDPALLSCESSVTSCEFDSPRRLGRALVRPVPFQLPAADAESGFKEALLSPPSAHHLPPSPPEHWEQQQDTDEGDPALIDSHGSSSGDSDGSPQPPHELVSSGKPHQPLSRRAPQVVPTHTPSPATPISHPHPSTNPRHSKPLPPPKAKSQNDMYSDGRDKEIASGCNSTPDLSGSSPVPHRSRCVSFMDSSAGAELGRFPADYLGGRPTDSYIGHADSLAKQLINSKPIEVVVYVTSEKIRLAPPRNSSLLFKSFAVKDILSVQKCSKNRRIVCVSVWKSRKAPPICHALRCPSALVSSALYDSILDQTQNVDDIASTSKLSSPRHRTPSSTTDGPHLTPDTPTTNDREVPTPPPMTPDPPEPQSPSEFLHRIPAVHVGSAKAGRHDSVNDVIQKVLLDHTPTGSREVSVWLSLAQLRLVDMSDEREMVYEAHETSRIRAIGVCLEDKRFIGYIIKEEGKPLVGHVLRCNSAALMVSLVSFLRQACQIMFSQQGGSLYDELSSDESDLESSNESPTPGHGILKKLRCITNPHKPLCQSISQPTFVSHTPPPHSPASHNQSPAFSDTSAKDFPLSPLDVPEEQFVRFSVTYVGSAVAEPPFSVATLSRSLSVFKEGGVAAGKAAVAKNVVQMHVSSLGINLVDKKHRLFVNRNYPRKQLVGYCRHPDDQKLFAFGSIRQGYPNEIKCHVFRRVQEPTEQILHAIQYWLDVAPITTSENQQPTQ